MKRSTTSILTSWVCESCVIRARRLVMKGLVVFSGLFIYLFAAVPVYASPKSFETEVINNVSIGDISIDLAVYEISDGEEVPCRDNKTVLPGQVISRIVRVRNLANPAWIRIRPEFAQDGDLICFPGSCIVPADERWVLIDGAWYFTSPLASGEEVDFIRELRVPASWDNAQSGRDLNLVITAEAVQEANFDPDFDSPDPWFGTLIETCVHSGKTSVPESVRDRTFSLTFEGGAEGLIRAGEDFFENFGSLMPGDTASDTLTLKNDYAKDVSIYFRTEGRPEDILAGEARLAIYGSAGVIFDGSLAQSREEVKIAVLKKGEEEKITYSVFIPPEADNAFALAQTADKWIFRAEPDTGTKPSSSGGRNSGGGGTATAYSTAKQPEPSAEFIYPVRELAKTGEGRSLISAAALMIVAGAFLCLIYYKKIHAAGSDDNSDQFSPVRTKDPKS